MLFILLILFFYQLFCLRILIILHSDTFVLTHHNIDSYGCLTSVSAYGEGYPRAHLYYRDGANSLDQSSVEQQ